MFKKDLKYIENKVINYLQNSFPDCKIDISKLILLHTGEFANATVFRYQDSFLDVTIKDFSGSPWLIKNTLGTIFINREYKNMKKLEDNPSVAKNSKKISKYTLIFDYIEGQPLKILPKKSLDKEFFVELEKNVHLMHKKEVVHLDLRNLGNIIMNKDGYPYIIDFQSAISTKWLTKSLKKILKASDMTGVYKSWKDKCSTPLDETRTEFLEKFNRIRKFWIFKGYPISRTFKKIKSKITGKPYK